MKVNPRDFAGLETVFLLFTIHNYYNQPMDVFMCGRACILVALKRGPISVFALRRILRTITELTNSI